MRVWLGGSGFGRYPCWRRLGSHLYGGRFQFFGLTFQQPLHGFSQIAQEVEAICYLGSVRRALGSSFGVGPGSIPADDFDPRMLTQPGRQGFGRPVGEQVDGLVAFQVNQDRAIGLPLAQRKIVYAKNARRDRRWLAQPPQETQ